MAFGTLTFARLMSSVVNITPPGYTFLRGQTTTGNYSTLRGQTSTGVYVNLLGKVS